MGADFEIKVVYASVTQQRQIALQVSKGTTVQEAIAQSGIEADFPGEGLGELSAGIFGKRVSPDHELQPGDRVEIYRPLLVDPKEARRQRARKS